jgi:zinc/manganese transport system substrate-binding protein
LVGIQLEVGWLPTLLTASRNGEVQRGGKGYLDASTLVSLLEVPTTPVDRSMGDVHPGGNPHYMFDPRRAAQVAEGIARKMGELDFGHRSAYLENAKSFNQKLEKWRQHWEKELLHLKGKHVIAYHQSMTYIADWLGFEITTHLEPKPGIPPNPGHVAHVIQVGESRGVKLLLQESYYPTKTSQLIAQKLGAKVAVIPGGPAFQSNESYIGFVNTYVERLKASAAP